MAAPDPLASASLALAVATGALYAFVGARLRRRRIAGDGRLAWTLFVHWWLGLSALTLLGGLQGVLPILGVTDAPTYVTLAYVDLLLVAYVLWALLYYLVYLLTGDSRIIFPISAFYVGCYVLLLYIVTAGGVHYDAAEQRLAFRAEPGAGMLAGMVLLLAGPHLVGALGYLRLYFAAEAPTQRYRIALVAGSILAWFSAVLVGFLPIGDAGFRSLGWWPLVTSVAGLLAALAILAAYVPPGWVRARYGIEPIEERTRAAEATP